MNNTKVLWLYLFLTVSLSGFTETRPDILLILVDDMGYSDLGCYGSCIQTPNIDALAEDGILFTSFYNGARCCPSRASILTGLYAHQAGIGHMTEDLGVPSYSGELDKNAVTIAEVLKTDGYYTAMAGKWHVTHHTSGNDPKDNWPLQRGFDRFYGTLPGHGSFFDPVGLVEGNTMIKAEGDYFYTEAITQKSIDYIEEAVAKNQPFFMYVAYTAPHYPLKARPEVIQKYKGFFSVGWDSLREQRYQNLLKKDIVDPRWSLPERDELSIPWKEEKEKAFQENRMEVYAAMIDMVDQGIGRIIEILKNTGRFENTVILFLSDNGGSAEGHRDGKIERWGTPWTSKLIPEFTRDGEKVIAGDFPGIPLGGPATYGSYGVRWANVSNAPFRLHKSWVHEGGISSPFIIHWAKGLKQKGISKQVGHIIDLMPTIIDVAEVSYPENYNGNSICTMEGIDLISLMNSNQTTERTLFWEHEGNRAVRNGNWKLVSQYPGTWSTVREYPKNGNWELYNLETDRTELNDLSDQYPDKVEELEKLWNNWAEKVGVIPWEKLAKGQY